MKSDLGRKKENLFWFILAFLASAALLLSSLYWNAGSTVLSQATQPSKLYSLLVIAKSTTSLWLPTVIIMLGFLLEKQRGSLKDLVCQWLYLIFFGLLFLLIAMFGFQVYSLNKFYVVIMPIIRNAYPLISGILLAQLLKPFFDQLYRFKKPAVIAEKVIIFFAIGALIPTFFNSDLFGFSGGYSLIFGCYSYLLGIALAKFIQLKKISLKPFKLIWLTGLSWLVSVVLNGLMPYISYAASISLRTASRFVAPSSFFNLLTAVFLWLSIWILFKKYFQKFSTIQNSRLLYQILGTLMIATGYPLCSTILSINSTWNPQQLGKIKLLLALIEAIILPIIIMLINLGLDHLFKKINSVFSLSQKLRIITAFLKNYQQVPHKLFEFLKVHRRSLLVFGWFFIIAAASMLVMNTSWKISPSPALTTNIFVYTLFIRFPIIILNVLIIGALFMILRFILADLYWLPLILVSLFYLIFSLISRQKLTIRNEPLLPADLSMIKDAGSLLGMANSTVVILMIVLAVILLAGAILLDIFRPVKRRTWKKRGIWLLISLAGLNMTFFLNHKNSPVQLISALIGNQPTFYNQPVGSQINGAVLQFLNNVDVKIMDQPAGYSKATMQKIAHKYQKAAAKINQTRKNDPSKQTVIFTLSESFSDPERVPQMTINKDPMPYLRNLKLKTTSGLMLSSGYGGGTANMEYMTLTGFSMSNFSQTLPTPYTQIVSNLKYNNSFNQIFKYSAAIHPYIGIYYNRVQVYQKFGFNRFYYLGSKHKIAYQKKIDRSPYLSDQTAYENAIDQVKRKSGGQFINLITMQNHYPFDKNFYNSVGFKVSGKAVPSSTDQASAEDFATGASYTDKYLKQFIKQLDAIKKPITLVWYGDHLPGIYSGDSMSQYGLELHETDYFIYSNKYAREHGMGITKDKSSKTNYVDPSDFIAMSLKQSNSKVSAYNALLTKVHQKLPAITVNSFSNGTNSYNTNAEFVNQHGRVVNYDSFTKRQKRLYHDYQLVQYDITSGKHYLAKNSFMYKTVK